MDQCVAGMQLLMNYIKAPNRANALGARNGIIYVRATDGKLSYDHVRQMKNWGWFQEEGVEVTVQSYAENWRDTGWCLYAL